jgi:drug/metabolite transporter (DMT)-like permease
MTQPTPQIPGTLNWALVNLLGVVWGTSFLSIGISLESFAPLTVAALRTSLAAIALCAAAAVTNQRLGTLAIARAWPFAAFSGVIGLALPFSLLAWGQQFVPSAVAGVAMGSVPLLLLPLVYVFSPEEGIGPRRIAGIGLGFTGLLLIVGPGALNGPGGLAAALGALACISAAGGYAVASVITRRSPATPPIAFAAATMLAAAVVLVPLALLIDGIPQEISTRSLVAIVYLALLPTAIASFLRVQIITSAGSLFMSVTAYLVPVWSVIFGVTLMGEDLPPQLYIALALILSGIGLSQSRKLGQILKRQT